MSRLGVRVVGSRGDILSVYVSCSRASIAHLHTRPRDYVQIIGRSL